MDFTKYQELASRTAKDQDTINGMIECVLGMNGETGELTDHIKKVVFHGHDLDIKHTVKELGDILWYVSEMARILRIPLETVALLNLEKLKRRYPEGFDQEKSRNRGEH